MHFLIDAMNPVSKSIAEDLLNNAAAANADQLGEQRMTPVLEAASGWDAYDVWRRFIKDARDRRELNSEV